jgi:hypothetical protein
MPDGQQTNIRGLNLTGRVGVVETSFTYAANDNHKQAGNNQMMSRMAAADFRVPLGKDLKLTGTYVRTNADEFKTSKELRLDYKGTDLKKVGSYGCIPAGLISSAMVICHMMMSGARCQPIRKAISLV